jgi:hypothetical protein
VKPLLKLLDAVARVLALLAALGLLALLLSPFGFFLGVMASDSGPKGFVWFYGVGLVVSSWLLICSARPAVLVGRLRRWPLLDFALTRVPVYAVAAFTIVTVAKYVGIRYDLARVPSPVAPALPQPNGHASQALQFGGSVPSSVPLEDFVAVYESEVDGRVAPGPCQRFFARGSKDLWVTVPLRHEDQVPLEIEEGRYHGTVYLDRYLPDRCHWHLTALYFRLRVEGKSYYPPTLGPGQIRIINEHYQGAQRAVQNQTLYRGPGHLWCRSRDRLPPDLRFYCGPVSAFALMMTKEQRALHETDNDSYTVVWVRAVDNALVEYDFDDVNALLH